MDSCVVYIVVLPKENLGHTRRVTFDIGSVVANVDVVDCLFPHIDFDEAMADVQALARSTNIETKGRWFG